MFRTVRLSIIRSLFTVHSEMVYVIQVCRQLSSRSVCSCSKAVYKPVWHIPLLSVQWINSWWWTDVSCQNKCGMSASSWFYYKEICYDARSHERKIVTYYWYYYLLLLLLLFLLNSQQFCRFSNSTGPNDQTPFCQKLSDYMTCSAFLPSAFECMEQGGD